MPGEPRHEAAMSADPPRPDAATATRVPCPACGTPFPWPPTRRCERCGADLASPVASRIFDLDRRWAQLAAARLELVRELEATRLTAPTASAPTPHQRPAPSPPAGGGRGVPALLGIAGAALLTAAAVVFTAVAWTALPALGKAAILLVATAAAAGGALRLHAREITTAASALGALTMALAVIDVAGADRVGLVQLGDLAVPAGLLAAALTGWLLARRGVGWVSGLGAVAAAAGAFGVVASLAETADLSPPVVTLLGSAAAAAVGGAAPTWPTRWARTASGVLAGVGLTLAGLVTAFSLPEEGTSLAAVLPAIAVPVAIAVAAAAAVSRWALTPASLLVTTTVVTGAVALGAEDHAIPAVAGAAFAAAAWAALRLDSRWRRPLLVGAAPVGVMTVGAVLTAMAMTAEGLGEHLSGGRPAQVDGWAVGATALAALAALAWRPLRRWVPTLLVVVLVVGSGAVSPTVAWVGLSGTALLATVIDRLTGRVTGDIGMPALALSVIAIAWASGGSWSTALAAGVAVAVAAHVVWHAAGLEGAVATAVGSAAAGLAAGTGLTALGVPADPALGAALLAVLAISVVVQAWGRPLLPVAAFGTAGVATVVIPLLAEEAATGGVLLLVAAVGWLAVAVAGWAPARWISSVVVSVGTGVLLRDAEVAAVEAYTVVPTLTLGAVGILWLRREPDVRTITALWPALTVAVAPSLLTLVDRPHVLLRAVLLAVFAGVFAGVGVTLRWLAPIVAGGIAALGVALTQLAVVAEVVPRWITFGAVGALLVWLAATYERQQARARRFTGHLAGLR